MAQRETVVYSTVELERWKAVLDRDPAFDGSFVYAVSTTRIYCRPTCPSRRPTRGRVQFFASPSEAEDSGYRPCRRCHPEDAASPAALQVETARQYLDDHLDENITLGRLGKETRMRPYQLHT